MRSLTPTLNSWSVERGLARGGDSEVAQHRCHQDPNIAPLSASPPPRGPVWAHSSQGVAPFRGSCHCACSGREFQAQRGGSVLRKHCSPRPSHNLGLEAIPGPHSLGLLINNVYNHPVIIIRSMTFPANLHVCLCRHGTAFCGESDPSPRQTLRSAIALVSFVISSS